MGSQRLSYEVIARRWRPQDFEGLVGQDHIRITLQNALRNQRLHHALLFTGPRGTGKTSSARILAKSLRCPNAKDYVPCNQCSECQEITSGHSLNVIEIDGASNNGVDSIRELRETVGYMPSSGKYKMYIIDEVHMLSTSAFNALLKTLEEPPEPVYFVMATTEVHKIPNTILSRCQRFDFRRIPTRVIAQHLQKICEKDSIKFESDALWTIARQADGSMRDAQSLLDQTINFTNGDLSRSLVVSTLGLTDRALLLDLLSAIVRKEIAALLDGLKRLHTSGGDAKLLLLDLLEQVRNTLLLKLSDDRSLVDLPDSEQEALFQLGKSLTPEDLHYLFDMCLKGAQDLARASDPLLVLEMVLMRMTSAPRIGSFSSATAPLTAAPVIPARPAPPLSAPSSPALRPMMATPSAHPLPSPSPSQPPNLRYQQLVEKIKEVNGLVGAQLENCHVVRLEERRLVLGIAAKHKFLYDKINQPEFKKKLVNYINSFWGPGYTLDVTLSSDSEEVVSPKLLAEKQEQERQQALRQAVEAHPLVKSAQSVFKTEIKSIKETKQ
jgi:DNA polymerase-3 subunit gamma/tau